MCLDKALELDPEAAEAWFQKGVTLERMGRHEEAVRAFVRTLALNHNHREARLRLAARYQQAGRIEEATRLMELARQQRPHEVNVLARLGELYLAQGRAEEALRCYNDALAIEPQAAIYHAEKGRALDALGRIEEAIEAFAEAARLEPGRAEFLFLHGLALERQGRAGEALEKLRRAVDLQPTYARAHSAALRLMHFDAANGPEGLAEEHLLWGDRHAGLVDPGPRTHAHTADPERRLRVGYVSPDFRRRAAAYLLAPVLESHTVETFCYWTAAGADHWTARLKRSGAEWREAARWSDAELAERIEADRIDILVDLSGHSEGNRLLAFARR